MPEPPAVLVVGDACPDLVLTGDVRPRFGQAEQVLDGADLVLGGSATITACALARLGVPVAVAAAVGTDAYGDAVRDALAAAGVDLRWLRRDPDVPTGLSVILSTAGDRAILTFPGAMARAGREVLPDPAQLRGVRHVHSAAAFVVPRLASLLPDWLAALDRREVTVSVDTNWDPDEDWTLARSLLAHADLFLPNTAELLAVAGRDDVEAAGPALAVPDGPVVALKNGADGGVVWTPDGSRLSAPGLAVDVVDTTGAGDAFDAGYLLGLVEGLPPQECLRRAVAAGSLSTRGVGGTAAQPDRATLEAALTAEGV